MANKRLQQLHINSVDVSSHVRKWRLMRNFGDPIDTLEIEFTRNITNALTLKESQTVELWFGFTTATDVKHFKGELIDYEPYLGSVKVKAFNALYPAVRKNMSAKIYQKDVVGNEIYPDGKISDAFTDIVTTYAGLTADSTTVQDSGTALTITKLVCDQTDPKERMDKCAEILGWIYFYRASTDKVYFQPKQFSTNSTILEVGSNVLEVPRWKYDKLDLINDLRVDGIFQQEQIEETFDGDGSTSTFTLESTPVGDVAIYVNSSKNYKTTDSPTEDERKTLGVTGATSGSFDFTMDKATKEIAFESGSIPTSSTKGILVRYVGVKAVPVHYRDDPSVTEYEEHARTIQATDTLTVADAEAKAVNVVDKFKIPFQSTTLKVRQTSGYAFDLGEQIKVIDSKNKPNVNKDMTIFGITYNYPGSFDEIKVGDREFESPEYFFNINERMHRLERELISEGTILTEIRSFTGELTLLPDTLTVLEEYINDSFIAGHSVNSLVYDAANWSIMDDFESSGDWSQGSGSVTLTIANNTTSGHYWIGSQGVKATWTASSGTGIIENTDSQGDLSGSVGVSSGTPTKGTAGVWVYLPTGSDMTDLTLRIGSGSSDYKDYTGQTYKKKVAATEAGFTIEDATRTYVLFDLDSPDGTSGTVDWTAIDFIQLRFTVAAAGDATFDYLTISKNDTIALNGAGVRPTTKASTVYTY